jgi:hypothetical protein
VDEIRYETARACLRAPPFVLAYRPGPDWIYAARRGVQTLSRVCGGAGAVVLPADNGGEEVPDLLYLVRAYDPDVIAASVPLLEDLACFDSSVVEWAMRWQENTGVDDPDAWERISAQSADCGPWDDVARWADTWCSPLKGHQQDARSLAAHEIAPMARRAESYPDSAVIPHVPGERVLTVDLSRAEPAVALMVESRLGALDAADRVRLQAIEVPVLESDLAHLVRVAMTGQARFSEWDLHARYMAAVGAVAPGEPPGQAGAQDEKYMQDMPFARASRWLTRVRTVAATPPPAVCVVGDAAADHALAPRSPPDMPGNEVHIGRLASPNVQSFLRSPVRDNCSGSFSAGRRVGGPPRPADGWADLWLSCNTRDMDGSRWAARTVACWCPARTAAGSQCACCPPPSVAASRES